MSKKMTADTQWIHEHFLHDNSKVRYDLFVDFRPLVDVLNRNVALGTDWCIWDRTTPGVRNVKKPIGPNEWCEAGADKAMVRAQLDLLFESMMDPRRKKVLLKELEAQERAKAEADSELWANIDILEKA